MIRLIGTFLLKAKIVLGVVITDVFHHAIQTLLVVGQQPFLDIVAQEVTEQTTEVFMTGIAYERTTIGEHTDKPAEQS